MLVPRRRRLNPRMPCDVVFIFHSAVKSSVAGVGAYAEVVDARRALIDDILR